MEKIEELKKDIEKTWLASNGVIEAIDMLNKAGLNNPFRILYYLEEGNILGKERYCLYLITKQKTHTARQSYGFFTYNLTTKYIKGCVSVFDSGQMPEDFVRFKELFQDLVTAREGRNEENSKEILNLIRVLFNPNGDHRENAIIENFIYCSSAYNPTMGKDVKIMEEPIKGCIDPREFLPKGDVILRAANYDFTRDIMVEHPYHGGYESHYMPVHYNQDKNTLYVCDTIGGICLSDPLISIPKECKEDGYKAISCNEVLRYSIVNDKIQLDKLSWYQDGKDASGSKVSVDVLSTANEEALAIDIAGFFMFRIDRSLDKVPYEEIILLSFGNGYYKEYDTGDNVLLNVLDYITKAKNIKFITGVGYPNQYSKKRSKFVDHRVDYTLSEGESEYKRKVSGILSVLDTNAFRDFVIMNQN